MVLREVVSGGVFMAPALQPIYPEALNRESMIMEFARAVPRLTFICVVLLLAVSLGVAQAAPPDSLPATAFPQELSKYPGLLPAFGELTEKLQKDVQFPPDRSQSQLLPLLPASTNVYFAFPNYGEAAHRSLDAFHDQLNESPALRDWWTHGEMIKMGPKIEDAIGKFSQVSEYLGDELVIAGSVEEKAPHLLLVSEVRKAGLKELLPELISQFAAKAKPPLRILDAQQLPTAVIAKDELLILVRPDFVVAATDLATLRDFNARLDHPTPDFPSTAFGQRVLQSYAAGVSSVGAADMQSILRQMPKPKGKDTEAFQRSGFADMKYVVWSHRTAGNNTLSEAELSFTGPRHGMAAWLAPPSQLGSLNLASPKAVMVASFKLTEPAQIFDDIINLQSGNPKTTASLEQMEHGLGISIKNDLLSELTGEITLELDSFTPPQAQYRLILGVKSPVRFQQTLNALLTAAHLPTRQMEQNGIKYQMIGVPSGKDVNPIALAFVGNYLVVVSNPDQLTEVTHLRTGGDSLAKSNKFLAALPSGRSEVSAVIYQDPVAMAAMQVQRFAPGMAGSLAAPSKEASPKVVAVYANESSISEASANSSFDSGAALVIAAIAIPNLVRARTAGNEASAVAKLRTTTTGQLTYAASYPDRGFASDLASLGPDPSGQGTISAEHAGLVAASIGNQGCTAGKWCEDTGYRFTMKANCGLGTCNDFVALASPVSPQTGSKTFCASSDGVIHFRAGPPLMAPVTVRECHSWPVLK